jgi:hypothetical protein
MRSKLMIPCLMSTKPLKSFMRIGVISTAVFVRLYSFNMPKHLTVFSQSYEYLQVHALFIILGILLFAMTIFYVQIEEIKTDCLRASAG